MLQASTLSSRPFWQPFSLTEPLRDAVGSPWRHRGFFCWGWLGLDGPNFDAVFHAWNVLMMIHGWNRRIFWMPSSTKNQGPVCLSSQRCTSALVLVTRDNPVDEVPVNLAHSAGIIGWTKTKQHEKKRAVIAWRFTDNLPLIFHIHWSAGFSLTVWNIWAYVLNSWPKVSFKGPDGAEPRPTSWFPWFSGNLFVAWPQVVKLQLGKQDKQVYTSSNSTVNVTISCKNEWACSNLPFQYKVRVK